MTIFYKRFGIEDDEVSYKRLGAQVDEMAHLDGRGPGL